MHRQFYSVMIKVGMQVYVFRIDNTLISMYTEIAMNQWVCPGEGLCRNRRKDGTTASEINKNES